MTDLLASTPRAPVHIAAAQARSIPGDIGANVATVAELTEAAANEGARLVVFPEKFLSGYEPQLIAGDPETYAIGRDDSRVEPIAAACRRRNITAVVGAATRDERGLSNSCLVFGPDGDLVARYDKQYLYPGESDLYRSGDSGCILEIGGWRLGLAVCYDAGFPEHARQAARSGCHAYIVSALFSVAVGYHESRTWLPARALDNTVYVVMANHVGSTGGYDTCGSSAAWGPNGDLLSEAGRQAQSIVVVELDPNIIADVRARATVLVDSSRFAPAANAKYALHQLG
ncbi:MAG: 5-aminopentanamidase [Candidatus Eremiobacteraeota bacterium]|jgi:predicted amidohydrolase|nr:5-aminopentanamidase [Candidatus Eremiobacteraeota bacterium]